MEKEVARIDKNEDEIANNISYRLQFIDSARFMASSLSNLVNNLSDELIKLNVTMDTVIKNVKLVLLKTMIATVFSNTQTLKMI